MSIDRRRGLVLDILGLVLLFPLLAVPFVTNDVLVHSLTEQIAIGVSATMGIYVMLRMGLLSFTVPAFMAVGGYTAAILATEDVTNLPLLMLASFVAPAVIAVPLGAVVLRLRGIYFIFVTFIFNEILQLVLFETPSLTGGANGIPGVPPVTLGSLDLGTPTMLVLVTVVLAIVAAFCTLAVTQRFRPEFASIEENETLTESLGVALWKYRTIGFVASAGIAGLAGLALVNMLSTAHPSSFSSWSVNNYIAYLFVGGRFTMLGAVIGSVLLIVATNALSTYAALAEGLFGVLLIAVLMLAPGGIVGTLVRLYDGLRRIRRAQSPLEPRRT